MTVAYTLRDLAAARVSASRFAAGPPDLAELHVARLQALSQAFGIDERSASRPRDARALDDVAAKVIEASAGLRSPFAGILEAPSVIARMYARHSAGVDAAIRQTEAALEALLVDLMVERYDIPDDRTVDGDDLKARGIDPSAALPPAATDEW